MTLQESGEMYLETIYVLSQKYKDVRAIDVSEYMGYSKPSVSRAVGLLKSGGYLVSDEMGHLSLTESGVEVAANVLLPAREVFDLLRCGAGIAAHLCVDLIEIVVLQIVIALLHPEYPAQDVRAAALHRAAAPLRRRSSACSGWSITT